MFFYHMAQPAKNTILFKFGIHLCIFGQILLATATELKIILILMLINNNDL